ncbi:MAG TPA: BrnT family toxin [Alphaproteobacteria bacterium]|nr:BrnT family toxin [Alphaproteobacteria bacterium]
MGEFVICIDQRSHPASLILSKVYRMLPNAKAAAHNMLPIFDVAHSHEEDRWITLGLGQSGNFLVVVHTFHQIDETSCRIRIISARRATACEIRQYQEGHT